jgi:hypothetical protein
MEEKIEGMKLVESLMISVWWIPSPIGKREEYLE